MENGQTAIVGAYRVFKTDTNTTYIYDEKLAKDLPAQIFIAKQVEPKTEIKKLKFDLIRCQYCNELIPGNGGSRFSHVLTHVRFLLTEKIITKEQFDSVRSVKLSEEIDLLVNKHIKDKIIKDTNAKT